MSESNRTNSLKSIYSRITSIQPAIDELANIGINVRDSAGEMRRVEDILDDLGAKWNTLSAEQQQNLGIQIAGRYQLSRLTLMSLLLQQCKKKKCAISGKLQRWTIPRKDYILL